ncbi:MAG: sulfite exporter TauE/SafE family protein [Phycisphaerae bacterium]|jgi:hypothetical protein
MMDLNEIPSHLNGPALVAGLAGLGLILGVLTGLFGVGGAFLMNPLLNAVLGIPYPLVTGSSLGFVLGNSSGAWAKHMRLGNVSVKMMLIMAGAASCGTILGADVQAHLNAACGEKVFTLIMHALFILLLLSIAGLIWRAPGDLAGRRVFLQRLPLPPRVDIASAHLSGVSLPGLCALGLLVGVVAGFFGVGGGVLFVPAMMLLAGLEVRLAIGTSLGVMLFCSLTGAIIYGMKGEATLWIIMPLLVGSSVGVQVGTALCQRLHAGRLRRGFAILVLLVAGYIGIDFAMKLREL